MRAAERCRARAGLRASCLLGMAALAVGILSTPPAAQSDPFPSDPELWEGLGLPARAAAWGDIDLDGDLDLALAAPPRILSNREGSFTWSWELNLAYSNRAIALGDVNGDGYLDMVSGNLEQRNTLYLNEHGRLNSTPVWSSALEFGTTSVALGDVDNDGDPDLVCGNSNDSNTLYLSIGDPTCFTHGPEWRSEATDLTQDVALGDMNGDGRLDLVCANLHTPNTMHLNLGPGDWFAEPASWTASTEEWTYAVALGDVDGDGRLDLVCGNRNHAVTLYLNGPDGLPPSPSWSSGALPSDVRGVALGDLDFDGDLDLVCASVDAGNYIVWNQQGMFAESPGWTSSEVSYSWGVAIGDGNGDGALDLAFANGDPQCTLYTNQKPVLFSSLPTWTALLEDHTGDLALADVNGDALLDLVVGNSNGDANALYLNVAGELPLFPDQHFGLGYDTIDLALGDVNGDELPEVAFANGPDPQTLHLNTGGEFSTEPVWIVDEWAAGTDIALGDMDNDGDTDLVLSTHEAAALYRNTGGALAVNPAWHPPVEYQSHQLGLCDMDRNGYLDVMTVALGRAALFPNRPAGLRTLPTWTVDHAGATLLTLGDVDGNGFADLVLGSEFSALYLNGAIGLATEPAWHSGVAGDLHRYAMADVDSDGWLDLVCCAWGYNTVFRNLGEGRLFTSDPAWTAGIFAHSNGIALGDVDADGDLDLVCGAVAQDDGPAANFMHSGLRNPPYAGDPHTPTNQLPNSPAYVRFVRVEEAGPNHYSIHLRAIDVESDPVCIRGGCRFGRDPTRHPVDLGAGEAAVGPLRSSPTGEPHTLDWNIRDLPFDEREVVLHLAVISHPTRAGAIQHAVKYQTPVGRLEPRRPELSVPLETLVFPTMTLGDSATATCPLHNVGNETLTVEAFDLPDEALHIAQTLPIEIVPGESFLLDVQLTPLASTAVSGELGVHSDDPLHPFWVVPIETDILRLGVTARLLLPEGESEVPLGEALTLFVSPAPQVSMDGGVLCHRPMGASGAAFDSVALVPSWDDFIAVIPGSAVTEAGLEYYIGVHNGLAVAILPPRAPEILFQRDVAAPSECFSSARPNSGVGFLEGRPIRIEASLPVGAELIEGWLHFRRGGESEDRTLPLEEAEDRFWFATIPDSLCGPRGLQYWVELASRTRTLTDPPDMPAGTAHSLPITVQNLAEEEDTPGGLYRMVTVPLQFGEEFTGTLASLLADQEAFGSYDPLRWRAFRYLPDSLAYIELDDAGAEEYFRPVPGRGFWLIAKAASRIATAPVSGLSPRLDAPFEIPLTPGWNQVGNPFAFPIAWDSVLVDTLTWQEARATGIVEPARPWLAEERTYGDSVVVLDPFSSCWVRLAGEYAAEASLEIPPREAPAEAPAAPPPARFAGATEALVPSGWVVGIDAHCGDRIDLGSALGVRDGASEAWDRHDRTDPPPAPGGAFSLYFPHGQWARNPGLYAVDMRPMRAGELAEDGWAWEFDVAKGFSGKRPDEIELRFAGLERVPGEIRLQLRDRELDLIIDLRDSDSYRFFAEQRAIRAFAAEARFLLLAGSEEFLETGLGPQFVPPRETRLHTAIPNPAWSSALIRYDLAAPGQVDLRLFDLRGALVRTLHVGHQEPGRYAVHWDGRDERGSLAAQGAYFCRLRSSGSDQARKLLVIR